MLFSLFIFPPSQNLFIYRFWVWSVVDLIALGKLFFHKSRQWLWNPMCNCSIPITCANALSPHSCVPECLSFLTFHMPSGLPRDVSHFFSHSFFGQGIPLIATKGAVSLSPLVLLSEPSSGNVWSVLVVSTQTRHIVPAHNGTRHVKLAPQQYFILYFFPSSSEDLFYIFLNTMECWTDIFIIELKASFLCGNS